MSYTSGRIVSGSLVLCRLGSWEAYDGSCLPTFGAAHLSHLQG